MPPETPICRRGHQRPCAHVDALADMFPPCLEAWADDGLGWYAAVGLPEARVPPPARAHRPARRRVSETGVHPLDALRVITSGVRLPGFEQPFDHGSSCARMDLDASLRGRTAYESPYFDGKHGQLPGGCLDAGWMWDDIEQRVRATAGLSRLGVRSKFGARPAHRHSSDRRLWCDTARSHGCDE